MVRNIGGTGDVSRSGGGSDQDGGGGSAGSQRAIERLRERFGGGTGGGGSDAGGGGGGGGGQPTPPQGAQRAIEQARDPADQTTDTGGGGGGGQPTPPQGAQRAIEQAPEPANRNIGGGGGQPTPPPGAQRAFGQAPDPSDRDTGGPQSQFDVRGPRAAQGVGFGVETVEQTGEAGPGLVGGIGGAAGDAAGVDLQGWLLGGLGAVMGPPGDVESAIGGTVEGAAQPIVGPPGAFENQTIGWATGPPGDVESAIGGAVEGAAQPVLGPPGKAEAALGSFAFDVGEASGAAAGWVGENIITPGAELTGDVADVGQQGLEAASPTTYLFGGDPATQLGEFETAVGDVFRGPGQDQGDPSLTESATEGFFGGGATLINEVTIGAPQHGVQLGQAGKSAAGFAGEALADEGWIGGGQEIAGAAQTTGAAILTGQATGLINNPFRAGGEIVTGGALIRGVERLTDAARVRVEGRGGPDVDAEDTTRQPGQVEAGESPTFTTDPDAPTSQALGEFRERAAEQPDDLQEQLGESIVFRSEESRLPGDMTGAQAAGRGNYELPGLFASGSFHPLRWPGGSGGLSSLKPRLPRPLSGPARASAFEAPDIEGMPDWASGFGWRGDAPDPETTGAQFLEGGDADAGTFYVRPPGSRSREFEAVAPPGSQFVRETTGTLTSGGTRGTLDIFRRVEGDADAGDVDAPDPADTFGIRDIERRESRGGRPEGQPVAPTTGTTGGTGTATGGATTDPFGMGTATFGGGATTSPQGVSADFSYPPGTFGGTPSGGGTTGGASGTGGGTTTGPTTTGGGSTGGTTGGGGTSGPSGGPTDPTGIFTGTPGEPTGTTPPSAPPSSPPSGPPSSPPGTPTGGPPSQPPTSIPGVPGAQPPEQPPRGRDDDDDDESFNPFALREPTGEQFVNPVVGGRTFLFGGGDGNDVLDVFRG